MVKGISKQVILVRPQEEALFEQAIFIVKDGVTGVTEKELLRQAQEAQDQVQRRAARPWRRTAVSFLCGGGLVGLAWALSMIL